MKNRFFRVSEKTVIDRALRPQKMWENLKKESEWLANQLSIDFLTYQKLRIGVEILGFSHSFAYIRKKF